ELFRIADCELGIFQPIEFEIRNSKFEIQGVLQCLELNAERSGIIAVKNFLALRRAITSTRASCTSLRKSRSRKLSAMLIATEKRASAIFGGCGLFELARLLVKMDSTTINSSSV